MTYHAVEGISRFPISSEGCNGEEARKAKDKAAEDGSLL